MSLTSSLSLQLMSALLTTYFPGLILYRLFLHPLSRFPGPTLAAVTDAYAGWYEVVQKGRILDQLEILHKKYGELQVDPLCRVHLTTLTGPVVRIGPGKVCFDH
jgi:hypothetical protein